MYALRNLLRDFTVFYGGVNDLWIIILYAAKIEGWVVGLYGLVVSIPACKPQVPEFESTRRHWVSEISPDVKFPYSAVLPTDWPWGGGKTPQVQYPPLNESVP